MKRLVIVNAGFFALMVLSGCVAQFERPTNTPDVMATLLAAPPVTPEPPTPTATPVPDSTPTPVPPIPTSTPVLPLFLEILKPDYGITVLSRNLTVSGTTNPGVTVVVGNRRAVVSNIGEFSVEVPLINEGINVVEVVATNALGEQLREFIPVTFVKPTPTPFTLQVTDPLDRLVVSNEFIAVGGRTLPQATVSVNGVGLSVDEDGDFSTAVRLTRGVNTIEVIARNTDGKVLSVQRTVIYSP
ncbi:MAG: hypothetical protein O2909_13180 [Chloroflexi bacterium]|nr:hypothetical protein [Chloroflexota bacterium]